MHTQTAEVISSLKAVEPQLRAFGVAGLYLFGSSRNEAEPEDVDVSIDKAPGTELAIEISATWAGYPGNWS